MTKWVAAMNLWTAEWTGDLESLPSRTAFQSLKLERDDDAVQIQRGRGQDE